MRSLRATKEITLDVDATDDPRHDELEGRFFHADYKSYCLFRCRCFAGDLLRWANIDASAGSVEKVARIVAQMDAHWPEVRRLLGADSGCTRDELMTW